MTGCLDGDSRAELMLLRTLRPIVASFFARRLTGDPASIEDLVQEVLIAVHERRASYDRNRPFTPWLFAIARHKLVDHFRQYRRHDPIEDFDERLSVESFQASSDARIDVASLLGTLPEKQARAIRNTRLLELSVPEAARAQGIGESDVKVSAHRGIRALSARMIGCTA
jgi:RNA polymerase sigma-70 factor (ECF subfamily)